MSEFVPAARVRRIRSSPSVAAATRVRELKAEGRAIFDLTVGEPDLDTPDHVKAAAKNAIDRGQTKYTSVSGTPELQEAILGQVKRHTDLTYSVDELTIGGGAKQVIFMALMATLDDGDEVVIPAPYWVSYPDMVLANEGRPVVIECSHEQGFKLKPDDLRQALNARSRWLILNTPSNPTGTAYTQSELVDLAEVIREHPQLYVLADEIYDEIFFGPNRAASLVSAAPDLKDRVLLVNGVSKSYAMTGWRLGYGMGPASLIAAINKLQSQISSCPSSISQAAAAAALSGDQTFVSNSVELYRRRRDAVVAAVNAIEGLSCTPPDGAFYAFVNCEGIIGRTTSEGKVLRTDEDFVMYLLDHAGVATIQGAAYGLSPYIRLSFATGMEVLEQATAAMAKAVADLERPTLK